jgi:hypothetical protein
MTPLKALTRKNWNLEMNSDKMMIDPAVTMAPMKFLRRNRFHRLHNKHQIETKWAKSHWSHKEQRKAQLQVVNLKIKNQVNQKNTLEEEILTMGLMLAFLKIRESARTLRPVACSRRSLKEINNFRNLLTQGLKCLGQQVAWRQLKVHSGAEIRVDTLVAQHNS